MSENDKTPPVDKKSSEKNVFFFVFLLLVVLAAGFFMMPKPAAVDVAEGLEAQVSMSEDEAEGVETEAIEELDNCVDEDQRFNEDGSLKEECADEASAEEDDAGSDEAAVAEASGDAPLFDLALAKTERVLGDSRAPIKITEHSSLTCGHCGMFHRNTFPEFKAAYIDTGKAYVVFSDFPLNAPALHASMIARCLPQDADYFGFVQGLFERQDDWAYDATKYIPYLRAKAGEYGLDDAGFDACIKNEELQEALLKRINAVQQKFDVRSTPSFVVNNQKVLSGAMDFAAFDKGIQDALVEIESGVVAPAPAEDHSHDHEPESSPEE